MTEYELVTIGLDCVFSVMLQLNQRDPELCVQALTSLLQLLQNLPPESLASEPPAMIEKMHDLLKRLRVEGKCLPRSRPSAIIVLLSRFR